MAKTNFRHVILALLGALLLAGQASVAQQLPGEDPAPQAGTAAQERASRRDTVRLYLVHRMRESLALSDAQTLKVMDVLEDLDRARQAHQASLHDLMAQLRARLDDPASTDAAFREAVAKVRKEQADFEAKSRELDDRLLGIMSPRQQAQFIVLRRQLLEELRQEITPPARDGRPGARWRR